MDLKSLTYVVASILYFVWDPLSLSAEGQSPDEYQSYALRVVAMLIQNPDADEVVELLNSMAAKEMGISHDPQIARSAVDAMFKCKNNLDAGTREIDPTRAMAILSLVCGKPAWSVRNGHGGSLSFEFGEPKLFIREPIAARPGALPKIQEELARRRVFVRGTWSLRTDCCHWALKRGDLEIAHSESPDDLIEAAARRLDGRKMISFSRDEMKGTWSLAFDAEFRLTTWPYEDHSPSFEQWIFAERNFGMYLSARADGRFCYEPGNAKPTDLS